MTEVFDVKDLTDRINKLKKSGDFTREFLECLAERHDLFSSIPNDLSISEIPESVMNSLRSGELPPKEDILLMDTELQTHLVIELIWMCGMQAISYYTEDEPEYLESILAMLDVSAGHYVGCYLISVFTLLMSKVPSMSLIETLTNNFDSSPEGLEKSQDIFLETAYSLFLRWTEDKGYYQTITSNFKEL